MNVGIIQLAKIHLRPLQSIVPPDRVCVPLDQLEESLDNGLLKRVARRAAVGISGDLVVAWPLIENIQETGRKIFEALVAQRPDWRPFDLGRAVERIVCLRRLVRRHVSSELRGAVKQDIVWKNCLAWPKIREAPRHPDFVALKDSGITLDRL